AMWRLELGDRDDPHLLLEGARQAYVAHDLVRAASLADGAWRSERTGEAGHPAGHLHCQLGHHEEAEAILAGAEQLLVSSGASDDRLRVLVAMARSENLFRSNRDAEAIEVVEAAEAGVADEDWRAELVGHRATLVMLGGEPGAAFDVVAPFLDHPSPRVFVQAAIAGATTMA